MIFCKIDKHFISFGSLIKSKLRKYFMTTHFFNVVISELYSI